MEIWHNYNAKNEYDYNFTWYGDLLDNELATAIRGTYTKRSSINNSVKRYRVGHSKHSKSYYDICASFDIETTTFYIDDTPYSTMYVWQFGINDTVIMGHTYEEFTALLTRIQSLIKPKQNQRLLVAVHNLAYEFSYIRDHLNITESFLKEIRQPLTLEHNGFFVFLDTLAITQSTLAKVGATYCNTQKCKGDLDYSVLRFADKDHATPLTRDEMGYCHNDVLILCEFMRFYNDTYLANGTRPMTATGILNNEINEEFKKYCEENPKHAERVRRSHPAKDDYIDIMKWCYRGGYTHSNMLFVGMEITSPLIGVDYTSSYPSVMMYRKFPQSMRKCERIKTIDDVIRYYKNDYASVFKMTLYGVKNRLNHSIESKSKCIELEGEYIDNGRVLCADKMTVYIDMLTLFNYLRFYDFESYEIYDVMIGKMDYLKPYLIQPMLKYYERKNYLKSIGEEGIEYKTAKGKVNSFYGLTVKSVPFERVTYSEGTWQTEPATEYERQMDNKALVCWIGIFVSSWARYNLLQSLADLEGMGVNCYYLDTDSIKMDDKPEARRYIADYNAKIKAMCEDAKKRTGATDLINGLGDFDIEFADGTKNGAITKLKYLGAKRYILTTNKGVELQTIAGLPKGWLFEAIRDKDNTYYNRDPFEAFNDNMVAVGCKLQSVYNDDPFEFECTDVNGEVYDVKELSCVSLVSANFSLSLDDAWAEFVKRLQMDARLKYTDLV